MSGVGYACAVLLAAVFAVAAAAKLRTPAQTAATFRLLRIPGAGALARAVPVVELLTATTLLAAPRAGAVAAIVLLGAFTVALARVVARGLDVSCGCFGLASRAPITTTTLLRNALLGAGALGAAVLADEPTAPSFAAVVLVTTSALLGAVALAAVDLRRTTGHVWKVDVPR